jgi:beta-lactamase superfamily II metal-dependent hydrolase
MKKYLFLSLFCAVGMYVSAQKIGDRLPVWQKGYLDIHHINTGCGECAFMILPDGTTLMVDAGANTPSGERHVAPRPNDNKTPGAWIANYVLKHFPENRTKVIDYFLATHFHGDHIGGVFKTKSTKADYYLTGISEIAESIPLGKIIDRGYPVYNFLKPVSDDQIFSNWLNFINYQKSLEPDIMEGFIVGANNQFVLKYDADTEYAGKFEIRNLIANGEMWTGDGAETVSLFPTLNGLKGSDIPEENSLSCAIKLSYGGFSYYTGGDLTGYPKPGRPVWHDLETPLAPVVGKTDVCVVNHHGYNNATNDVFIKTLAPQVFIIQAWDALHPNHSTLYRMLAKQLYPNNRDVFATNLHPAAKIVIGDLTNQIKSTQGHIVIRVSPGGSDFMVYILNDANGDYIVIKAVYGPYLCSGGNIGTAENPYIISDAARLATLAANVNEGQSYQNKHFRLVADIDLGGYPNWTPVGYGTNGNNSFKGFFHGGGHSISNLKANGTNDLGLFGSISGAVIDSLYLLNVKISGTGARKGGLAGTALNNSVIKDCYVSGSISGGGNNGGLIGDMRKSAVYRCFSNVHVSGNDTQGGLVGIQDGG